VAANEARLPKRPRLSYLGPASSTSSTSLSNHSAISAPPRRSSSSASLPTSRVSRQPSLNLNLYRADSIHSGTFSNYSRNRPVGRPEILFPTPWQPSIYSSPNDLSHLVSALSPTSPLSQQSSQALQAQQTNEPFQGGGYGGNSTEASPTVSWLNIGSPDPLQQYFTSPVGPFLVGDAGPGLSDQAVIESLQSPASAQFESPGFNNFIFHPLAQQPNQLPGNLDLSVPGSTLIQTEQSLLSWNNMADTAAVRPDGEWRNGADFGGSPTHQENAQTLPNTGSSSNNDGYGTDGSYGPPPTYYPATYAEYNPLPPPYDPQLTARQNSSTSYQSSSLARAETDIVLPKWQNDGDVTHCPICGVSFTFWTRKHHCR
jgi:hypothetical protein